MKTTPEPSQPIRHSHGLVATGVLAASIAAAVIATAPAGATVDANPNAIRFGPVSCPAIGRTFDEVWLPTINSKAGHVLGGVVGVAKSLYFTDATGTPLIPLYDRPGIGLNANTVWCFWPFAGSPTGYGGGDILFRADVRS